MNKYIVSLSDGKTVLAAKHVYEDTPFLAYSQFRSWMEDHLPIEGKYTIEICKL